MSYMRGVRKECSILINPLFLIVHIEETWTNKYQTNKHQKRAKEFENMDLDDLLPSVGEFGKYQKLILTFILLPAVFPCGFHAYNQLFMATVPDHWCKVPQLSALDQNLVKNLSIPLEIGLDQTSRYSRCFMLDMPYENFSVDQLNGRQTKNKIENLMKNSSKIPCKHGWIYNINNVENSVTSEWNLVCEKDFSPTLALVLFGISGLIGNYIFGYIQDGFGRKPAYFIYLFIQCVFGIATAFAHSFWIWVLFRVGVGFTVPAILGTPCVLAIELVGPKDRTTVTILINIAYSLALTTLAVIVWAIRNWRWMALATTLPFMVLFVFWWLLPESPRWLLAKGRIKEAEAILENMARVNGKKLPPDFVSNYAQKWLQSQKDVEDITHQKYGIVDLFRSPNLRWKTIIITFLWFTNTSVYVGLSYYAPALGGDEFWNFFLAGAVEFPTYLFLWPAMERLGRRWTLCLSMVVGGTSCLATFLVQNDYQITLALYCVGKMGISSSFVVLPLMASELYPTVVRGLGMSLSSVVGMLGPVFIPLVNYMGSDMIILPLIIMGTLLVMGGLCSLLLPETLDQHLPQSLQDAELHGLDFCASCIATQRIGVQTVGKNGNNNNNRIRRGNRKISETEF